MLTESIRKILDTENADFIGRIRDNLSRTGTNATMESSQSIHAVISEEGARIINEIFAKPFFSVVETGRKPTPDKKPSREMIENITKWASVRGNEDFVWAIAVNINKKGTKLWQQGGRTDIYTDEKEVFADKVFTSLTEDIASELYKKATIAFS